jgi:hypothetical protein
VDFYAKIKFGPRLYGESVLASLGGSGMIYFISMLEGLPGAGFGKRISQNPVFKELRSQNLENKRFRVA